MQSFTKICRVDILYKRMCYNASTFTINKIIWDFYHSQLKQLICLINDYHNTQELIMNWQ